MAVVTGASAGIGAQICRDLCANNVIVIGLARRGNLLEDLGKDIRSQHPTAQFMGISCDITKEDQIRVAFEQTVQKFGGVDILVNNAGIFPNASLLEDNVENLIADTLQTNVSALISCTRKAFKSMVDRDTEGYIVNISSIAGHAVIPAPPGAKPFPGIYYGSKHAVTAVNRAIGQELVFYNKPKIRVSNISPGVVRTDIFQTGGFGNAFDELPQLNSKDISDTLLFILSTPSHVQIRDIIVEPVGSAQY